jgi:hypothetical protein
MPAFPTSQITPFTLLGLAFTWEKEKVWFWLNDTEYIQESLSYVAKKFLSTTSFFVVLSILPFMNSFLSFHFLQKVDMIFNQFNTLFLSLLKLLKIQSKLHFRRIANILDSKFQIL